MDEQAFRWVAKQSTLINVGRGSSIHNDALLNALQEQTLRSAILDVFEQEPLEQTHPLWHHPRVRITPHTAAESMPEKIVELFAENYQRFNQKKPLLHTIDITKGY